MPKCLLSWTRKCFANIIFLSSFLLSVLVAIGSREVYYRRWFSLLEASYSHILWTARKFCRSRNDSSENFRGYRVWKNEDSNIFITLSSANGNGNCTENVTLKAFCTARTVFSSYNQTHLLLKIKNTIHSDGGLYGVGTVFENLSGNHLEVTKLSVIELKLDGK